MQYTNVSSLKWANADHSMIECVVDFVEFGPSPFGAIRGDLETHGQEIFNRCVAGEFGPIAEFVPPPPPSVEAMSFMIRDQRNTLLNQSDWTDTLSAKSRLGDDLYNAWQTYRQALRDIPSQDGFPANTIFPTPPQ